MGVGHGYWEMVQEAGGAAFCFPGPAEDFPGNISLEGSHKVCSLAHGFCPHVLGC